MTALLAANVPVATTPLEAALKAGRAEPRAHSFDEAAGVTAPGTGVPAGAGIIESLLVSVCVMN